MDDITRLHFDRDHRGARRYQEFYFRGPPLPGIKLFDSRGDHLLCHKVFGDIPLIRAETILLEYCRLYAGEGAKKTDIKQIQFESVFR